MRGKGKEKWALVTESEEATVGGLKLFRVEEWTKGDKEKVAKRPCLHCDGWEADSVLSTSVLN